MRRFEALRSPELARGGALRQINAICLRLQHFGSAPLAAEHNGASTRLALLAFFSSHTNFLLNTSLGRFRKTSARESLELLARDVRL